MFFPTLVGFAVLLVWFPPKGGDATEEGLAPKAPFPLRVGMVRWVVES